jgi:ankyrin repeat protein
MKTAIDLDSRDGDGRSPLSWAAANGHGAIVEMLLKQEGVDADSRDKDEPSPLSWAAAYPHIEIVEMLLKQEGADADSLWAALNG